MFILQGFVRFKEKPLMLESSSLDNFFGNSNAVDQIKAHFAKLRGSASGSKYEKMLLVYGPSGCGKTLAVKLILKKLGLLQIYIDTSELRSKIALGKMLALKSSKNIDTLIQGKYQEHAIILDQVDNFVTSGKNSSGRDFVKYVHEKIGSSSIPVICICDKRYLTRVRTLHKLCALVEFEPLSDKDSIAFAKYICETNKQLKICSADIHKIIRLANGDARQLIHHLRHVSDLKKRSNKLAKVFADDISALQKDSRKDVSSSFKSLFLDRQTKLVARSVNTYFRDSNMMPMLVQTNVYPKITNLNMLQEIAHSYSNADILEAQTPFYSADATSEYVACLTLGKAAAVTAFDPKFNKAIQQMQVRIKNPEISMTNIRNAQNGYLRTLGFYSPCLRNRAIAMHVQHVFCDKFAKVREIGVHSENATAILAEVVAVVEGLMATRRNKTPEMCIDFINNLSKLKHLCDIDKPNSPGDSGEHTKHAKYAKHDAKYAKHDARHAKHDATPPVEQKQRLCDIWKKQLANKMFKCFDAHKKTTIGLKFASETSSKPKLNFFVKRTSMN